MMAQDTGPARFGVERYPVVLFDFDGTLANTGAAVMRIARTVLERRGIEPTEGDLSKMIGPPLVDGFRDVFGLAQGEAEELTAAYRALFATDVTAADYPPIPGVPELLEGLRAQGRRLAVATSRMEASAREMIEGLGWAPLFDAVCGRIEPGRLTKADSIRAVLAELGASPRDAVMVGDRHHDVEGSREVGMSCIGVYTGAALPGEHDIADASCRDMAEVARLLGVA